MQERAERWASTMRGHSDAGVAWAHADSWAGPGDRRTLVREAREEAERDQLALHATQAFGAGDRVARGAARPVPHLLRARPRPDPALGRLPAAGRQDPGVRVPRRSSANSPDARPRGRPGRPFGRGRDRAQRGAHRGDRARSRLRPRPGRPRLRGRPLAVRPGGLRPRRLGRRRHAHAAQPVRRDARRGAQPLVEPPGADDTRRRGRVVGRPDRLRLPRLRGRGRGRHRHRTRCCRRSSAAGSATTARPSSAR